MTIMNMTARHVASRAALNVWYDSQWALPVYSVPVDFKGKVKTDPMSGIEYWYPITNEWYDLDHPELLWGRIVGLRAPSLTNWVQEIVTRVGRNESYPTGTKWRKLPFMEIRGWEG